MQAERWQQIEKLFYVVLECAPNERAAYLVQACAGNEELRREVESLLAAHEQGGSLLENVASDLAAEWVKEQLSPVNQMLGHFRILSLLGKGGMGEVWLAEDTELHRKVALKLLPARFTQDQDRLQRFEQEARAVSALNHPNIITIHEIGQTNGIHYIVTEYIDGQTLRQALTTRIKLQAALDIAIQVASALSAAHATGIMHRDIKPENIMLRPDGLVKVLDFGLAKLTEQPNQQRTIASGKPTTADVKTAPGQVIGTVRYMSPEQVRGSGVDARSDIFSLGVVLYEMVAGRAPFEDTTPSDVMAAILKTEPVPLSAYSPGAPSELERVIAKALRKDQEERYQGVKDLMVDLKDLKQELELEAKLARAHRPDLRSDSRAARSEGQVSAETGQMETAHKPRWSRWGVKAALVLGGVAVSIALWSLWPRSGPGTKDAPTSLRNAAFTQLTDQPGPELFPSLAPDGKSLVYASRAAGNWDIYWQRVGGRNPINLTRDSSANDTHPAFSPDGEQIAFRSSREGGGIFVMGATGESVKRLTDFGHHPVWSPDGKEILYATDDIGNPSSRNNTPSQVWSVNTATGEKRLVTPGDAVQPHWSPHGMRIAYWGTHKGGQRDIWTMPARGGEPVEVTNDPALDWNPVWSPDGNYLYFASDRGGSMNLWRVRVEEQSGKVLGPPEPATTPSTYSEHLSFSRDGRRLAYVQVVRRDQLQKVGFDPATGTVVGQPVWITQGSRRATDPDLSPDGEWLVFSSVGEKREDLFIIKTDGTSLRQLTDDIYKDRRPRWSPDGKRIAFFSDRSGRYEIWVINSDGSRLEQITYASDPGAIHPIWSPDGTRLAYHIQDGNSFIIEVGKPWQEQSPQALPSLSNPNRWFTAWSWSPDGRKLAGRPRSAEGYTSGIALYSLESQQYEKLTDFGRFPIWLNDNRRLLFRHRDKLFLVNSQTKKVREVLSVDPHRILDFALSRDDRLIYFSLVSTEADIWLLTL